jgi:hypothetical protein
MVLGIEQLHILSDNEETFISIFVNRNRSIRSYIKIKENNGDTLVLERIEFGHTDRETS